MRRRRKGKKGRGKGKRGKDEKEDEDVEDINTLANDEIKFRKNLKVKKLDEKKKNVRFADVSAVRNQSKITVNFETGAAATVFPKGTAPN
eukprot:10454175-Karenia_brevis.AAC.1